MKLVHYTREIYLLRRSLQYELQYDFFFFLLFQKKKFASIGKFKNRQKNPKF